MNRKLVIILVGAVVASLLVGLMIGRLGGSGTSGHAHSEQPANGTAQASAPTIWTCSMHPQIQQPKAGDCPICGMDLIPLDANDGDDLGPRVMSMSEASRALAEIQTTEVVRDFPEAQIRLVGQLDYDATREKSLTARFPARIDELFVNYNGIRVRRGEHMARVYSPELLTAQRELLGAHRADPNSSMTAAATEKLRLWDLLPEQIEAILEEGAAQDHFVLQAPVGGIVVSKQVQEGDYVDTGTTLFRIADLDVLWARLDAYESDLQWLRYGQDIEFTVAAYPGETFTGKISFMNPEVDRRSRTVAVRVNVPNADGRLKPGMFVRGTVASQLAEDGSVRVPELAGKWISPMHPEVIKDGPGQCDVCGMDLVAAEDLGYVGPSGAGAPLIVPSSAVLRTGKRAVVYIEIPDTESPTFEGREIVLGPRAGEHFIVQSGLAEGDRVVTKGAFKIDSALQIQAKPSMMSAPESGHSEQPVGVLPLEIAAENFADLLNPYLALQAALAGDDLAAAQAEVRNLMEVSGHAGPLAQLVHGMLDAQTVAELRLPHFETLSNGMIAAARAQGGDLGSPLFVMYCPMVDNDRGAAWLQSDQPLRNPYFGAMMFRCGETQEELGANDSAQTGHDH